MVSNIFSSIAASFKNDKFHLSIECWISKNAIKLSIFTFSSATPRRVQRQTVPRQNPFLTRRFFCHNRHQTLTYATNYHLLVNDLKKKLLDRCVSVLVSFWKEGNSWRIKASANFQFRRIRVPGVGWKPCVWLYSDSDWHKYSILLEYYLLKALCLIIFKLGQTRNFMKGFFFHRLKNMSKII